MKLADIKKIDRSKLPNEDFKNLYDEIKNGTGDFDEEFIELFDSEIKEFLTAVKKYVPEAITERVVKVRQPRKKVEKPIDFEDDDVVETVMEDYNLTKDKAVKLIALRKEAYELKKENIEKLLDRLDKSEFYQGRNYASKSPIDKGRTRDLGKDSKQGSITLAEERKMTKTPFKRISKEGRKNQYGTTEGGNVYYEYRMNRRDVDKKIKLKTGGAIDSNFKVGDKVQFSVPYFESQFDYKGTIIELRGSYAVVEYYEPLTDKTLRTHKDLTRLTKTKFDKGGDVGIPNSDKMFHLPYEIAVYVPSTKDVDKNITATELRARVKEVEKYLAETFGGFTSAEKVGGYLSSKSSVVTEKVIPVTAFATMQSFKDNKAKLVNKMSVWAKKWGQEAIGFEFEGDLYYVPQKFKKGGKLTATYIPKRDIKTLTTVWGNNIKGKDLIDGAYTLRTDIKRQPKMVRSMFEEEEFSDFKTGGLLQDPNDLYKLLNQAEINWQKDDGAEYKKIQMLIAKNNNLYYKQLNDAEKNYFQDKGAEYERLIKMKAKFKTGGGIPTKMTNEEIINYLKKYKFAVIRPLGISAMAMDNLLFVSYGRQMGYIRFLENTKKEATDGLTELHVSDAEGGQKLTGRVIELTPDKIYDIIMQTNYMYSKFEKGGKTKPKDPVIVRGFSDDEPYEYAQGGGIEHGFKVGDEILKIDGNVVVVLPIGSDKTSNTINYDIVNISNGKRINGIDYFSMSQTNQKNWLK